MGCTGYCQALVKPYCGADCGARAKRERPGRQAPAACLDP
jgi:hypothetical protein